MKIRLGILDSNSRYIRRLIDYFSSHYAEELVISAFSDFDRLEEHLSRSRLDVLLAEEDLLPETFEPPKSTILAYLSESPDIQTIRDVRAVCKYQKTEQLYREILNLYAELDRRASYRMSADACPVYLFMGAAGGVGTTTAAAACAVNLTNVGYKVLYLNLEDNGTIAEIFTGDGQMTLSDVLYEIKSNKSNLALKLESMIRKDKTGVYFYEPFAVTLDAREMMADDLKEMLTLLTKYGSFDYVIVDSESAITDRRETLLKFATRILLVSDGNKNANRKLERTLQEFVIKDEHEDDRVFAKTQVVYNRFGRNSAKANTEYQESVFNTIENVERNAPTQIVNEIARRNYFGRLAQG